MIKFPKNKNSKFQSLHSEKIGIWNLRFLNLKLEFKKLEF